MRLFLIIALFCSVGFSHAQNNITALLDSATIAYAEGEFDKALSYYQEVNLTHQSADLYLNMGHCAYQMDARASTILYYERALRLAPSHQEALRCLGLAKQEVNDGFSEAGESNLGRSFDAFLYAHAPSYWRTITVILLIVAFSLLILQLFKQGRFRKWLRSFGIVSLVLGLSTLFISWLHYDYQYTNDEGIIFAQVVKVRQEANLMSAEVIILKEGSKVNIEESSNNWVRISLDNGTTGWIPEKDLSTI